MSKKRLGYAVIAAFGVLFMLLMGYDAISSLLREGAVVYESPKYGVEAHGTPAIVMYIAMISGGGVLAAYGIRGVLIS